MKVTLRLTKNHVNSHCRNHIAANKILFIGITIILILLGGCSTSQKNSRSTVEGEISSASESKSNRTVHTNVKINEKDEKKYQTALMLLEDGEHQGALELFKQVSVDYPKLSGSFINMGIISIKQRNFLEAESYFQQARNLRPDNAEIYNYLGIVYRQQGRFSDADNAYRKALELDKNMAKIYLNLAILNDLYLANYTEAERNYKKYQQLVPENEKINAWLMDLSNRKQVSVK